MFVVTLFICVVMSALTVKAGFDAGETLTPSSNGRIMQRLIPEELDAEYWKRSAQDHLYSIVNDPRIMSMSANGKAKNVILFLGDGMSLATVAATRMYLGGEEKSLSFEKFPHFGLSKTYCVDKQVADSSCSSTAYLCGVKANYGTMGVTGNVKVNSCNGQNDKNEQAISIAKWAQNSCKSTGLVTTAKLTDASPGGLYSHIANRDWENDQKVRQFNCDPSTTVDIARQFIENDVSKQFKVVSAGGREEFRDRSMRDEEAKPGLRGDNRDLINEWLSTRTKQGKSAYVWDKKGLQSIANDTEYILGLFSDKHCPFNIEIDQNRWHDRKPKLSEMTETAIKHLQKKNKNGFFLFVESARIDMAHHDNWARIALDETKEFSKTIEMARNMTDESDTLIVVTSDHSHTMTYNGYSYSGNDILGLATVMGSDNLPYTTLSYANGPGYYDTYDEHGGRIDLSKVNRTDIWYRYPATVPLDSETHGGEDVGIFASGPQSHMFVGNYEQSYIPMLMANAAEMGPFAKQEKCLKSTSSTMAVHVAPIVLSVIAAIALKMF